MTLIAICVHADSAEILTDSWAWTPGYRHINNTSKVMALPHFNAAVVLNGSQTWGSEWKYVARSVADVAPNLDDLNEATPDLARQVLAAMTAKERAQVEQNYPTIFHVGYSLGAGRFMATEFDYLFDFEPRPVETGFVTPAPFSVRLSAYEHRRLTWVIRAQEDALEIGQHLEHWAAKPALNPTTDLEWILAARQVRTDRAKTSVGGGLKTLIGGDITHTMIADGFVISRRLDQQQDTEADFAEMMAGTLHPTGQRGPCPCGSGVPFRDCCLLLDHPCPCQSKKTVRECCLVHDDQDFDIAGALAVTQ